MPPHQPRYSAEEAARRGDEIYEREVRAQVEAENHGKVVAIDIETGAYALDENALAVEAEATGTYSLARRCSTDMTRGYTWWKAVS